ncbi:growth-regulating factor 5 [Lactuca sativa]|uniref:Growth-regulating factor n=1 Tax=Lactuca sativa TaxID=4236 RepID=A0A9R1XFU4_LACSA|nr:growth-regulating factor 5 [Lactuca sativa]KAJ0213070.1 hypothetical protein LSAT_V11C400193910 [Lactuca sativa]
MMSSGSNLNLFTAAQWEELEQQALIYKYMVSGVPVPTHLILSVRRSLYNSSFTNPSNQFGVWEGNFQYNQLYQIGGRKIDMEPGRCRRTDGKKWRCSKEAYPDSKYCERHMHRGRNRSRKPVEFPSSSSTATSSSSSTTANVSSSPLTTTTNISKSISPSDHLTYHNTTLHTRSSPIQTNFIDYRYLQDERSVFFPQNDPYTSQKMTVNAPSSSDHQNYSHFNFQNLKNQQQHKEEDIDFIKSSEETKSSIQIDTKLDEIPNKQTFHHFFAPQKPNDTPSWVDVDHHHHQHQNLINPQKSPLSTQDLFQSKPRSYW